jgi:hypothetical protein
MRKGVAKYLNNLVVLKTAAQMAKEKLDFQELRIKIPNFRAP